MIVKQWGLHHEFSFGEGHFFSLPFKRAVLEFIIQVLCVHWFEMAENYDVNFGQLYPEIK